MGPLARTLGSRTADDGFERRALDPSTWIDLLAGVERPGNESEHLRTTMSRQRVHGHEKVRTYGHERSALMATKSPHFWPREVRTSH